MLKGITYVKIVTPSKEYLDSFLKVLNDYNKDTNPFGRGGIDPLIKAINEHKIDEYFQKLIDYEQEDKLPTGYVPEIRLWFLDEDRFIGVFSIRHRLTPKLEQNGGHISANIMPKYRGTYLSFIGLKMCLSKAHEFGLQHVLITCDADNLRSYKCIKGLLQMYRGTQLSDYIALGHVEHRVWLNTNL